jgi:hypothetical protein
MWHVACASGGVISFEIGGVPIHHYLACCATLLVFF